MLGDSGYPCRRYLLTPFLQPRTQPQVRYNRAHKRTRVIVEHSIGVLKKRFPCLHFGLRCLTGRSPAIIAACIVLNNIAILRRLEEPDENFAVDTEEPDGPVGEGNGHFRDSFVDTHFT